MRLIAEILRRLDAIERRLANSVRDGKVAQVDPIAKRVRLRLSGPDGEPFLSPWAPYAQHAGALKIHSPPSVGQQMTLISPAGDLRQGRAVPFTWSDSEPAPSDAGDLHLLTFGDVRIEVSSSAVAVRVGATEFRISSDEIAAISALIRTDGETRLDGGDRAVVFLGSADSGGDTNTEGATRVFV